MNSRLATGMISVLAVAGMAAAQDRKPSPFATPSEPERQTIQSEQPKRGAVRTESVAAGSPAAAAKPFVEGSSENEGLACFFVMSAQKEGPSGERRLAAAHPSLPIGTRVRVTNVGNSRSVVVTVTDHGSFEGGRIISVSKPAAEQLGFVSAGTARVKLELITGKEAAL